MPLLRPGKLSSPDDLPLHPARGDLLMSFILKDGSEVADRRLGCIYQPAPDRPRYQIMSLLGGLKPPRSYTWRCSKVLDQGREGACCGFGTAHELIARPAERKDIDNEAARKIYWSAQKKDPWPGGAYTGALPFYEGSTVEAAARAAVEAGYIDSFYWAATLDELILGVGYAGPAVIGVDWYEGMFETSRDGYISPIGQKQGGHCVAITGVNVARREFWGVNSWGTDWGIDGFFRIRWSHMEKLLAERGVACFFKGRHRM